MTDDAESDAEKILDGLDPQCRTLTLAGVMMTRAVSGTPGPSNSDTPVIWSIFNDGAKAEVTADHPVSGLDKLASAIIRDMRWIVGDDPPIGYGITFGVDLPASADADAGPAITAIVADLTGRIMVVVKRDGRAGIGVVRYDTQPDRYNGKVAEVCDAMKRVIGAAQSWRN